MWPQQVWDQGRCQLTSSTYPDGRTLVTLNVVLAMILSVLARWYIFKYFFVRFASIFFLIFFPFRCWTFQPCWHHHCSSFDPKSFLIPKWSRTTSWTKLQDPWSQNPWPHPSRWQLFLSRSVWPVVSAGVATPICCTTKAQCYTLPPV